MKKGGYLFPFAKIFGGFLLVIFGLLFVLVLFGNVFVIDDAGYAGVIYDPLAGGVQQNVLNEGFYLFFPWQSVTHYDVRTQSYNMHTGGDDVSLSVLTTEGLTVTIDLSVIYHIEKQKAPEIHQTVGIYYAEVLLKPIVRSTTRDLVALYSAEDLYTTEKRAVLQSSLTKRIKEKLQERGIQIEDVLIRDIELPVQIQNAIQSKVAAEQDAQRMEFVLQKEEKEADRKVIEANGITESQRIIADSLTDSYLTWYWIQNLKEHESVIYVPVGNNGLPLFKDIDTTDSPVE